MTTFRLICQLSLPVADSGVGDSVYSELKTFLQSKSSAATLNGQIVAMLEPCCGQKVQNVQNPYIPQIPQRPNV